MARDLTLTLDEKTIKRIESAAERLGKTKSQVVEEAMADYRRPDKLTEAERQRRLQALDEMMRRPSPKSADDVQREIDDIRTARRSGGRRTPVE
jgi:predicted transcriptional regulator